MMKNIVIIHFDLSNCVLVCTGLISDILFYYISDINLVQTEMDRVEIKTRMKPIYFTDASTQFPTIVNFFPQSCFDFCQVPQTEEPKTGRNGRGSTVGKVCKNSFR